MAVRSKAQLCGRLIAGTADSNPTEGMAVRLLCLLCVVYVEVSTMTRSLVQGSTTERVRVCVCACVCVTKCNSILYTCKKTRKRASTKKNCNVKIVNDDRNYDDDDDNSVQIDYCLLTCWVNIAKIKHISSSNTERTHSSKATQKKRTQHGRQNEANFNADDDYDDTQHAYKRNSNYKEVKCKNTSNCGQLHRSDDFVKINTQLLRRLDR